MAASAAVTVVGATTVGTKRGSTLDGGGWRKGKSTTTAAAVRSRRRFAGLLLLLLVLAVAVLKRDSMQLLAPTIYSGSASSKSSSSSRGSRAHCRPDLPGCVPKRIDYVYFLHVPKAGGMSVRTYLEREGTKGATRAMGAPLALCPMRNIMAGEYYCYARDVPPEQRTPAAQRTCWGQQESLAGLRRVRPLFGRVVTSAATGNQAGCNYAIGHYDFGLVDTLPPEQAQHTLVVVNLREPTQRVLSSYYYMRKLGLGQMCPAGPDACLPILNFTRDGFQGERPRNRQMRMMAGDYCCYHGDDAEAQQQQGDDARLETALANLDRVGAVIVSEHMSESLQYVGWLLDYQGSDTGAAANLNRARPNTTDAGLLAAVGALMREDDVLYSHALRRLQEQQAAMHAAAVGSTTVTSGGVDSSSSSSSEDTAKIAAKAAEAATTPAKTLTDD